MGNTHTHIFEDLSSKSPEKVELALKELWKKEDTDKSSCLEKKEAHHLYQKIYTFLREKKNEVFEDSEDRTVQNWVDTFVKDEKLFYPDFKESVLNLVNAKKEYYEVLVLQQISLQDLPTDKKSNTFCKIIYPGHVERSTDTLLDDNPVWNSHFVYFPTQPYSNFEIDVITRNPPHDIPIGSVKLEIAKIIEKCPPPSVYSQAQKIVETGDLKLSPDLSASAKKLNKHPKYTLQFEYQKWGVHYGFEDETHSMNVFNRMFWTALKQIKHQSITASQIKPPTEKKMLVTVAFTPTISVATEDLTVPDLPAAGAAFCKMLCELPRCDDKTSWCNRKEGVDMISRLMGNHLPPSPEGAWIGEDVTSDKMLTRLFFQGIGATSIHREADGDFVVDFELYKKFEVRNGYVPYHGKLVFTPTGVPIHIIHNNETSKPGDKSWELAKYIMRSTALTIATGEHLIIGHFLWSNLTVQAVCGYLGPDHPIRRLLHIHTYGAVHVNANALQILVPSGGALDRCMGFTYPSLQQAFDVLFTSYHFETYPNFLKKSNMIGVDPNLFPMGQDALDYYNILYTYVKDYVHLFYDDHKLPTTDAELCEFWTHYSKSFPNGLPPLSLDNLVDVLTQFIFTVTGWHTQVGNVSPYSWDPAFAGPAMIHGVSITFPQVVFLQNLITLGTAGDLPLIIDDFSQIMLNNESKKVLEKFHNSLKQLSVSIDERNQKRTWVYNCFNPKFIATSIAV